MLDHLVHFEPEVTSREGFVKLDDASPEDVLSAQVATEQWLAELGVDDDETVANQQQTQAARKAFNTVTTNADTTEQKASLAELPVKEQSAAIGSVPRVFNRVQDRNLAAKVVEQALSSAKLKPEQEIQFMRSYVTISQ